MILAIAFHPRQFWFLFWRKNWAEKNIINSAFAKREIWFFFAILRRSIFLNAKPFQQSTTNTNKPTIPFICIVSILESYPWWLPKSSQSLSKSTKFWFNVTKQNWKYSFILTVSIVPNNNNSNDTNLSLAKTLLV